MFGVAIYGFRVVISDRSIISGDFLKPFECGFRSMSGVEIKISLRFYHILVVFLLMDVEVVMIFFIPNIMSLRIFGEIKFIVLILLMYFMVLMYELLIGGLS